MTLHAGVRLGTQLMLVHESVAGVEVVGADGTGPVAHEADLGDRGRVEVRRDAVKGRSVSLEDHRVGIIAWGSLEDHRVGSGVS